MEALVSKELISPDRIDELKKVIESYKCMNDDLKELQNIIHKGQQLNAEYTQVNREYMQMNKNYKHDMKKLFKRNKY